MTQDIMQFILDQAPMVVVLAVAAYRLESIAVRFIDSCEAEKALLIRFLLDSKNEE